MATKSGAAVVMLLALGACSSAPDLASKAEWPDVEMGAKAPDSATMDSLSSWKDKALEMVGLKKPEPPPLPDSALPDRKVMWRLYASPSLNVSASGEPLALLTRLYKLKSPNAFMQAPYETFGDPAREKAQLGDDLIEAREVQLIPGQHEAVLDKVAREVRYVGIVALFNRPAPQRWRYAFRSEAAERTGLSIGLLACAMTVQSGEPIGHPLAFARSTALPCP